MKCSEQERFWNKVLIAPFHSCWEWTGHKSQKGYGRFYYKAKKYKYAHRYSLEICGKTDPGLVIDHKCKNRACVNPDHLREVTAAINALENSDGIALKNKQKTHCIHGHEFNASNTKIRKSGARGCKACIKKSRNKKTCTK